jgi:uncharacterized membrane protein YhaH (DUF805 family)
MTGMHWYTDVVFKKYAVFHGRATRPEYWWFWLADLIVAVVVGIVVLVVSGSGTAAQGSINIYNLAVLLPTLGLAIRRLHDTNRSGWWVLIGIIPIIGWIWILVLMASASDSGPNRYGPNPQAGQAPPYDAPRFDAQTGEPLQPPTATVPRFDPQTGQPLPPHVDPPVNPPS